MNSGVAHTLNDLASHSVHCPNCQEKFPAKFAKFGFSNYQLIGCEHCANLLALYDLDPVILYLDGKFGDNKAEFQRAVTRALMTCPCGGKFKVFDDRRRCPLCRGEMKEIQMSAQVPEMGPEMQPIPAKLFSLGNETWAHLEFLHPEIQLAAKEYENEPTVGGSPDSNQLWLAKVIYDTHFRKMTPEKIKLIAPKRSDLFLFNNRLYHDHGGAFGPWWKFWDREMIFPEKCGMVYDIDQKTFKCASCRESFPAQIS